MQTQVTTTRIKRTLLERFSSTQDRAAARPVPTRRFFGDECYLEPAGGVNAETAERAVRAFDAYENAQAIHGRMLDSEETDPLRLMSSADVLEDRFSELRAAIDALRTTSPAS